MRSYILAAAGSAVIAALYVYQNPEPISVSFLSLQRSFPHGVWGAVIFGLGAVLMWIFSLLASLELHADYKKKLDSRDEQIAKLQDERDAMLHAFKLLPTTTTAQSSIASTEESVHEEHSDASPDNADGSEETERSEEEEKESADF